MKSPDGLTVVITGEGKGKTTAAMGLVLRSLGHGKKVLIIQFGKASFSGEIKALEKFGDSVKLIQGGKGFVGILGDKKTLEEHKTAAKATLDQLTKEMKVNKWDMIVADEIIGAVSGKLLTKEAILSLIDQKPTALDLVLTGRGADASIIKKADLVSKVKSIKHPFEKGVKIKKGIDF